MRILFLMACLLAGCVHSGGSGSYDALSAGYGADAGELAAHVAGELDQRHAPAHTRVALHRVPGRLGEALENDLRSRGFAMAAPGATSALGVT